MPPPSLTIQLFGPLRVLIGGEPMPRLRTRPVEWLLALLVLRHGRAVDRSWLAGTLWPESDERQALHNLRDALVHLRKALGPERARLDSPTRDTLRLDLTGAEVDVVRFDAALKAGDEESLRSAIEHSTGPLLEGCLEPWVFPERESREQACLTALETLAGSAEQCGDYAGALALLRRAESLDNLRDSIQRPLMRVLAASGDTPAALLAYRDYRLRLHREMNVEPDADTVRLFQQIRARGGEGVRGGRGDRTTLRVGSPPHPLTPSPPHPLTPSPAPLPHPITALIGREEDVREVVTRIAASRLVTLAGAGGVGKTRLAIEAAREAADGFPEGAAFVALASLSDPALLPSFVATALGLREPGATGPESVLEALFAWLSVHPVLLVLDNCEHLIGAAAALCQTLLERCPRLHILATSRQRLGLTGEVVQRVPSLACPDPEPLPPDGNSSTATVMQYPAVQLFVERAQMVKPGFRLTGREDAAAVAQICQRLDGIPLAIELAAARTGFLSLPQIASRLGERFQLLTGGSSSTLTRHQTLYALIDWSYELLTEPERALLRRLSVCVDGWTLEAAEALCADFGFWILDFGLSPTKTSDPLAPLTLSPIQNPKSKIQNPEVLELLASLTDKSLVLAEEAPLSPRGTGAGEGLRYRMLETVREYAREKLQAWGEEARVRSAHAAYFLALAETAAAAIYGPEQLQWLNLLEAEHGNLRAALAGCLGTPGGEEVGRRLAAALAAFWELRGDLSEGREALSAALALPGAPADRTRARILVGAGRLARLQGNWPAARAFWTEALGIWRQLGDRKGVAEMLEGLADLANEEYHFTSAASLLEESLTHWRDLGDREGGSRSLRLMAQIAEQQGLFPAARAGLEEALGLHREMGDRRAEAADLLALGKLLVDQGDCLTARTTLEECLAILREVADRWSAAEALFYLGRVAHALGDLRAARRLWEETLALDIEKMGRGGYVVLCLAQLTAAEGDATAARAQYEQFIRQELEAGTRSGAPSGLVALAELDWQEGDVARATTRFQESLTLFEKVGDQDGILPGLYALWSVAHLGGDDSSARAWHARLLATHQGISNRSRLVWSLNYLGIMARHDGDVRAAQALHTQSLTIGREIAYYKGIVACIEAVAGLAVDQQPDRAARLCGAAESLRALVGHWRDPFDQANLQAALAAARAALGPKAFAAAWAEGHAMSLDQAVEYASSDAARRIPPSRTHPASIHPVSPSRLPRPLTALIGREEEVEAVMALVDSARLVMLTGGGGIGKTRVALQVAAGQEARYPGRVAFVELAALADPVPLPVSVAAALGLHEAGAGPARNLMQALTDWLSQEPALLVLDNCEHLIEAAAALCQTLLERCPRLHILATSRQRLGLTGEIVRRVPSLAAPDPEQLPPDAEEAVAHVLQFSAARLFIERAAAVRPGFQLRDREEALAVARLCQRLDGIPLALELAAARTTVLSVEQIAARLDDRFQLLTGGSRAALPRHQTLRALIDWSYESLPAEEAALLRRLAVFAGGWTLEAAEAVCGGEASRVCGVGGRESEPATLHPTPCSLLPSPVLDLLDALEECSLVLAEAGAAGLRYRMLETVREYSQQKLQACGKEASVRSAHATYFLALAETAAPAMHGPEPLPWLNLLEAEHDNLRAALEWCGKAVDSGHEARLRLAAALWPFWEARGYLSEGRQYLRAALQPSGLSEAPARAQALLGAARLALHQGDLPEAETFAQEGQEWFRSQGDARGRAMALLCRGEVAFARGQFVAAESLFAEGLEACRQSGWTQGTARALVKLGAVAVMLADTARARTPLEEGLALAKTLGDPPTLALALYERGCLAMREEDDARAGALLEQSVEIWRRLGYKQATAEALGALGRLAGRRKDRTRAASFLEQSAATYRELGARIDLAWTLQELGNVQYSGDAYVPARAAYEESLGIFRELNDRHGIACASNNLGMVCFNLGDPAGAEALHREALAIYGSRDHGEGMVWSLGRLGLAAARRGDALRAARLLAAAAAARERLGQPKAGAEQAEWDPSIAALRAGLPAAAFETAWAEGHAMSLEEAVRVALEESAIPTTGGKDA